MQTPAHIVFPRLRRRFTQAMVNRYGLVNDDQNLIHYKAKAARRAGFPQPVVHGALVAALLSEACRDYFGSVWLDHGQMKVAFIKPLLVDQVVMTGAAIVEPTSGADRSRLLFDVWCENQAGERVLVGQASCIPPAG